MVFAFTTGACALGAACEFPTHELRPEHKCNLCNKVTHVMCATFNNESDSHCYKFDCRRPHGDSTTTTISAPNQSEIRVPLLLPMAAPNNESITKYLCQQIDNSFDGVNELVSTLHKNALRSNECVIISTDYSVTQSCVGDSTQLGQVLFKSGDTCKDYKTLCFDASSFDVIMGFTVSITQECIRCNRFSINRNKKKTNSNQEI